MGKRVLWIDNLSGLLIIQMIFLCHVRILASSIPDTSILFDIQYVLVFFMPWFFYKSGMFYKEIPAKDGLKKDANKLLKPFLYYSLFGYVLQLTCVILRHEPMTLQSLVNDQLMGLALSAGVSWEQPLWFLITLFLVKNIFIFIQQYLNKYILLVASLLAAYYFSNQSLALNFWIGTTCQSLFFYALGYLLKGWQFRKELLFVSLLIYLSRYVFGWVHSWDARINEIGVGDFYLLTILVLVSGIILFNNVFMKCFDRNIPLLSFIGEKSMFFFVAHFPCVMFCRLYVMPYLGMEGTMKGYCVCSFLMIIYLALFYLLLSRLKQTRIKRV